VAVKLQGILDDLATRSGTGGMTATVMGPAGTWSGAAGKADDAHDMKLNSQFSIASGTKPIVAAQVMQLVEVGEIDLDRPATDYLPADFTFDTNGATIRELLSHRSGIPDWYSDAMEELVSTDRSRVWELDDILALVDPARGAIGVHQYADTNYNLLGLVIEHVRQRPLVEVLRDGVLRVPGTERLIYQPNEAPTDPLAMPNGETRDALEQGAGFLPSMSEASSCGPACAMASDSISLAHWWRAFCAGEVVSEISLTEMSTFSEGEDGYGLGLANPVEGYALAVGHLGANFGFISASGCLTEDPLIFVVLTNQRTSHGAGLAVPLVQAALSE
jgi:D-alanyl-D-alanine carboxypeptidase